MNEKQAITLCRKQHWKRYNLTSLEFVFNRELQLMMQDGVLWRHMVVRHKGRDVRRRVSLSRYVQMMAQEIERRKERPVKLWSIQQAFINQLLYGTSTLNPTKMFFVGTPRSYGKSIVNMIHDEWVVVDE